MLNHKVRNDVTYDYVVNDVEQLREPMQQVTDALLRAAEGKATGGAPAPNEATPPHTYVGT